MPIKKNQTGYIWYQSSLENVEVVPVKDDDGTVMSQKNPGRKHFWELSVPQGLAHVSFVGNVLK